MDSIVGMDPLPVRPEKLAMAGVMITKGTMEEALFSSAGKHGTLGFLENKGAMISKIPAKDKPLPMAEEGQSADKIKEKMLMVRDLDVNEEMENLIGVIMDKRAKGLLKETVWGANKKPEVLLDQVFSTQKMDVAAKEGEEGGVGKEWDQWKEALSNHLRDYKVRMGRKAKIGCSRDELLGQVGSLKNKSTPLEPPAPILLERMKRWPGILWSGPHPKLRKPLTRLMSLPGRTSSRWRAW
jgi:hypothetical protein